MAQPIIKRARVHFDPSEGERQRSAHDPRATQPGAAEPAQHGKLVRLLEEDGRVIGVELRCSCGEVTAVELEYPASGTNAQASPPPTPEPSPTPAS